MSLQQRLQDELKSAMKAGDAETRDTLRMALAACKNAAIALGRGLEDAEVLSVLEKELKKREDAATQFEAGKRPELAAKERAEAVILAGYLPAKLGEEETKRLVQSLIAAQGLTSKKDLGKLMKAVLAEHKGQVDGKLVQRLAGELLS